MGNAACAIRLHEEPAAFPRGLMILVDDQMPSILIDFGLQGRIHFEASRNGLPFMKVQSDVQLEVAGVGQMPGEEAGMLCTVKALQNMLHVWDGEHGLLCSNALMARECRRLKLGLIRELLAWAKNDSPRTRMMIAAQFAG